MGVTSSNWFAGALLSVRRMFAASCGPMFKPPSFGPPYFGSSGMWFVRMWCLIIIVL